MAKAVKPHDKQVKAMNEIKKSFRENLHETNEEKIKELLIKANSTVNYLKVITPKRLQVKDEEEGGEREGKATYVLNEHGKWVLGRAVTKVNAKAAHSNWRGDNLDPDMLARHNHLLDRQHFGGRR